MIVGIGMDLTEIKRITKALNRTSMSFVKRMLTDNELSYFQEIENEKRRMEWLAGRFAAKEAGVKAIGTGFGKQIGLKDLEVKPNHLGKPEFYLSGKVQSLFSENTIFHLTITHTEETAAAFVIIESDI
ncbi:holo-[acyl-carrier-protein] synthase [Bacillus sp. CH30_1T]|uniref:holo-ACP synthase n=1 Tax=Bacillus sp. CH30_1T TaxID=2604836 RepID=UPI0011ED1B9A|nr:holo-ACP synthase [Bacillus sp. CH30_1T]KAA0560845.1 holo-[acyl-carrier-protein] synthase [Bacillus sp. CH30_1T]